LEELKRAIKNNLKEEKTVNLAQKKRIEILDKIIESSKMDVPNILVIAEKNKMREEMKASITQMGVKWEDYLSHIKKTEEEIEKDWDQDALKRAKYNLAIEEIAVREKIGVPEEELGLETDKLMEYYSARYKDIDRDRVKAYTYDMMKNQKVFNLLESKK
jgi:trigger factor